MPAPAQGQGIVGFAASGTMTDANDAAAGVAASSYPLIVYIHVPKTAGTTVKRVLHLCAPRGHNCVEMIARDPAVFLETARNSDWIAGHVFRDEIHQRLTWFGRSIEYFATVREPVAQLVSHLNWSFERFERFGTQDYYDLHRPSEQQIDAAVMSVDFSNPFEIMNFLSRHAESYLNLQSRYVLGRDSAKISADEVSRRLAMYTYVATEPNLSKLFRAFGFAQLPQAVDEIRDNTSVRMRFNPVIFDSPQLKAFLAHNHRFDLSLYAAVTRITWPGEVRLPFRPAFIVSELFTLENFNERLYLDSCPDVATAVSQGHFQSGRAHFESVGSTERRAIRRWCLPQAAAARPTPVEAQVSGSSAFGRLRELREKHTQIATIFPPRQQGGG